MNPARPLPRLLAPWLLLLAAPPVLAGTAAPPAPATLPPLPEAQRDWDKLLREGELDYVGKASDLIDAMYDESGPAADCDAHLADVDAYLTRVPVGAALWNAAARCAGAKGDTARAGHYEEGLARLAAHAFGRDSSGPWAEPIAIVNINDAYSLASTTGMDVLHVYLDPSRLPRHYAVVLALWDEDAKVERHLSFDFVGILSQLRSSEPWAGYPATRSQFRESVINAQVEAKDLLGLDMKAVRDASGESPEVAVAALRDPAAAGGVLSLAAWLEACDGRPASCGEGAVDALLPLAEEKLAIYRVLLALAQARGIGTRRDEDAAMALLDSAEARWPGHAQAQFAEWWMDMDDKPLPRAVDTRLARAAEAGSLRAAAARLRERVRLDKDWRMDEATLAMATPLGDTLPYAAYVLYRHHAAANEVAPAMDWLRRAAAAGYSDAMLALSYELFDGEHAKADWRAAVDWMRKAAQAGETDAMEWLGAAAATAERWKEAEAWYVSAAFDGSKDGLLGMANLYSRQRPGLDNGPARARQLYQTLVDKFPSEEARRAYALFLLTQEPKDPAKARSLLLQDAAKDPYSQFFLGLQMLRGRFGADQVDEGMERVTKAVAAKPAYGDGLATFLYYRVRSDEARQRALKIERQLVAQDDAAAINNLAWWLCVSPQPAVSNPAEGLAATKKLPPLEALDAGVLDTVAACHAATGDFDAAARIQALAIDRFAYLPDSPADEKEMRARLELYRQRKPYVERPEDESPGED